MLFLFPPLYIICSAILFLKRTWPVKLVLAALVVLATSKTKLYSIVGPHWFTTPDCLPRPVLYILTVSYSIAVIFLCLLLLTDALQCLPVAYIVWRRRRWLPRVRAWRGMLHLALLAAAVLLGGVGTWNALALPAVKRLTVAVHGLNSKAGAVTIAFLADLHADPFFPADHLQKIVDITNGQHPDIVLLGGDMVDGEVFRRQGILQPLAGLSSVYGTYGIAGNHEYYSGYDAWSEVLRGYGITLLDNAHIELSECGLAICGVTDPGAARFNLPPTDVSAATAGISPALTRILLAHRPGIAFQAQSLPAGQRPALQLSGHTHGGMFPGFSALVGHLNGGFSAGLYQLSSMQLYVSRGTAIWNGFPLRLFCPSEITLIRLVPAP